MFPENIVVLLYFFINPNTTEHVNELSIVLVHELKMDHFGNKFHVKNGWKVCCSENDPGPRGLLTQVFHPILKLWPTHVTR